MSGSGAGLNRVVQNILTIPNTSVTAVASPLAGYGTLGVNDSGMWLNEAMGFTKWTFSLLAPGTGWTVTLYGTTDPAAYGVWRSMLNPGQPVSGSPGSARNSLAATSWFVLPGPSEQTGTGAIANPMTSTTPIFQFSGTLVAVRAVVTAVATPTGTPTVSVEAVP